MFLVKTVFRGSEPAGDVGIFAVTGFVGFPPAPTVVAGTKSLSARIRGRSNVVFHLAKNRELSASLMCSSLVVSAEVSNGQHELSSIFVCRTDPIRCALIPAVHLAALQAARSSASLSLNVRTLVEVSATLSCTTTTTFNLSATPQVQAYLEGALVCRSSASAYVASSIPLSVSVSSIASTVLDLRAGKTLLDATATATTYAHGILTIDHIADMAASVSAQSTALCSLNRAVFLAGNAMATASSAAAIDHINTLSASVSARSTAVASIINIVELSAFATSRCSATIRVFGRRAFLSPAGVFVADEAVVVIPETPVLWVTKR